MKWASEAILVIDSAFLRSEELIKFVEDQNKWRDGTAGGANNPTVRITSMYDLNHLDKELEGELCEELLDTFLGGVNYYKAKFQHLNIVSGENLRVAKYEKGGFYKPHVDSVGQRLVSAVLYLNDDFRGGILKFPVQGIEIDPKPGRLVIFPSIYTHPHESTEITEGIKYACPFWAK